MDAESGCEGDCVTLNYHYRATVPKRSTDRHTLAERSRAGEELGLMGDISNALIWLIADDDRL